MVDPYIAQPKVCFSCFRFGHVANQCKNPRCRFCGSSPHEEGHLCPQTNGPHTCLNCKGPHLISDKNCPAFKNQSTIRKIAAYKNIPIKEASQLFYQEKKRSETGNIPFEPNFLFNKKNNVQKHATQNTPKFNYSNFPSLGEVNLDSPLGNFDPSSTPSYAGVVFSKPKSPQKSPHKQSHNKNSHTTQKVRQQLNLTPRRLQSQLTNTA